MLVKKVDMDASLNGFAFSALSSGGWRIELPCSGGPVWCCTVSGLWNLIGKLVDIFLPHECANYFRSCGYEPE